MFVAGCGGHGRPHGTIVFSTFDAGRVAFYGVRPDGTGLVRLPPGAAKHAIDAAREPGRPARKIPEVSLPAVESVYDETLSSDGRWFSFGANEGLREGLYVVRSDGTRLHRIAR